jgi:hypothetical protein
VSVCGKLLEGQRKRGKKDGQEGDEQAFAVASPKPEPPPVMRTCFPSTPKMLAMVRWERDMAGIVVRWAMRFVGELRRG